MNQLDKVFHTEHGTGSIVSIRHRRDTKLLQCFFPEGQITEWVTDRSLLEDTHQSVSLQRREVQEDAQVSDDIQAALENLFFGGQKPRE